MENRVKSRLIPDYSGQSADTQSLSVLGLASLVLGVAQLFVIQYSTMISGIYLTFMNRGRATHAEAIFMTLILPVMATLLGGMGLYLASSQKAVRTQGAGLCWAGFMLGTAWLFILMVMMAR